MTNLHSAFRKPNWLNPFVYMVLAAAQSLSCNVAAQGFGLGTQGMNAQDAINAARGGASGLGDFGMGAAGAGNVLGDLSPGRAILLGMPSSNEYDSSTSDSESKTAPKAFKPLYANEFQKYVFSITGVAYSLYGADFFENSQNAGTNLAANPVADDYVLGPGDQLQIRVWGSASATMQPTIDRNGQISLPKVGTFSIAGVRASQAQGLIKAQFARIYNNFDLSVTLGRLRKITVYVVGQSRAPGSYALSSQTTLTNGLFASGGPNSNGSIRRVQLKRNGAIVSEFDLYAFLSKGDKAADVKLLDGDVIFYPRAAGYMAFTGKVNTPGIYEVKDASETLGDFLNLAGGLPVVADPRHVSVQRLQPGVDQPRSIENFSLDVHGLKREVKTGDLVEVAGIVPELSNAVTLRGNVSQAGRVAWRPGFRISDLINRKSLLISPDSVRKQNEVLFTGFEQERSARYRARVPDDLWRERMQGQAESEAKVKEKTATAPADARAVDVASQAMDALSQSSHSNTNASFIPEDTLLDRIGSLIDEVNLDYAVVERIHRNDLSVSVIPFNLGRVLANAGDPDNLMLEPGDVVTVFSAKDLNVPLSKRRAFVRVEGEVNKPGVYPVGLGESLSSIITKAGGTTTDAYLYGIGFFREDVKKSQRENLAKLLRRLESESAGAVTQLSQSMGATSDAGVAQAKIVAVQQAQRQSVERVRSLKPEGRIALGMPAALESKLDNLPNMRLQNGDRINIPSRPDLVYVFGSVNTESALLFKKGFTVSDYLQTIGSNTNADRDGVILMRADGSALTNDSFWRNVVLGTEVMPGDTIVVPEKLDRESVWSTVVRNTKDLTQVMYQLGLGAAALKTLRQ